MNKQTIYREGQVVYLPTNWREKAPIGALTNFERARNERLMKIAEVRPWNIKEIRGRMGRNTYVLEQHDITDPDTGVVWTWNTIHDPPTKDVLDRGFQEYVNRVRQKSFEQAVGLQLNQLSHKYPNLEAWGKLRCETVEDCRKIIKEMFQFLKEYPTIRERLYKSLGDGMRFRIKKSKRKSRKRRSVKRKASRKRKKKTVKELRAECKAQGLVYDPKTKKCRVSKRRSAKRKSRKVSRKRRSAKRKVSRKRRSAKRKSRKRKSRKSSRKKVIGGKMRTIHKSKNPIPYDEDWAKGFVTHIGPGGGGGVNNYTGTKKVPTRRILDARKKLIDKIYFLHDQLVALDSSLVKDMFAVEILNPTEWRDPPQYMDRDDLKHYVKIMKADVKSEKQKLKKSHKFSAGNKTQTLRKIKHKFRNGDGKQKKMPKYTKYTQCYKREKSKGGLFGSSDPKCLQAVAKYKGALGLTVDFNKGPMGTSSSWYL